MKELRILAEDRTTGYAVTVLAIDGDDGDGDHYIDFYDVGRIYLNVVNADGKESEIEFVWEP